MGGGYSGSPWGKSMHPPLLTVDPGQIPWDRQDLPFLDGMGESAPSTNRVPPSKIMYLLDPVFGNELSTPSSEGKSNSHRRGK